MNRRKYTKKVLERELELSETVEQRLQETYEQIRGGEQKEVKRKRKYNWGKIAVAAAMAVAIGGIGMGTSFAVNGVPKGIKEMFDSEYKKSVEKHTIQQDNGKGGFVEVVMPAVEFVPLDEMLANRILNGCVSEEPIVKQIGEHTMTIESYVTDGQAFCAYMTLERPGGVTAMYGGELNNQSKGMYITEESDFYYNFIGQEESAGTLEWLDMERSTEDKYYITIYGLWSDWCETPSILIEKYPCTLKEYWESEEPILPEEEIVEFPKVNLLENRKFVQDGDTIISYSPISMRIYTGYVYANPESNDPIQMEYIEIVYKDGTSYIVYEDDEIDNTGYCCGYDEFFGLTFNRLVDIDQIKQIKVNDKTFDIQN